MIDEIDPRLQHSISQKSNLGITKNCWAMPLPAIAAKIYYAQLLNRMGFVIEKNIRTVFDEIDPRDRLWVYVESSEDCTKSIKITLMSIHFSSAINSIYREKMQQIPMAYIPSRETATAIMILYNNTKKMIRSPYGDTSFFDIVSWAL